ncbi:MAG: hypothetical protein E7085_04755 [Parabacteroides distasonis]|nr:hypothetical protein [Parabacteroides distasonis]
MPSFYIPQLKASLPILEECYGFDLSEISSELSLIVGLHHREKRFNKELANQFTDKNGYLDSASYAINTNDSLGIRVTEDFDKQIDAIVDLCGQCIEDKDLLETVTFILVFMSAVFNRNENDLYLDEEAENIRQDFMRNTYVVRPDLLRLFIALNKPKHKYNTPMKICFKTDSPHMVQNKDAWFENLGKDEPKEEQVTSAEVEDCGCSDDEAPKTWKAIINGEEQEIIIGFTECNVSVSKKKEVLFKLAKKDDLLPVKYNVVDAKLFWDERYLVFDHEGNEISNGTPNVYVLCPEPGTNCRVFFDEVLADVEVHEFESVQDWAKKVGATNQLCQGFDKVKEVAVAGLATGNEAAKQVARFAMENKLPESVSEYYNKAHFTPKTLAVMMFGHKSKMEITLGRTPEDAQRLFNRIKLTFGEAEAKKRYAIRAIDSLLEGGDYDLDTILEALRTIPAEKVTYAKLKKCGDKESCIVMVLTSWIIRMQREELNQAA